MHRKIWLRDRILENKWTHGAELGLWDGRTYLYLLNECPDLNLIGVDCWQDNGIYTGTDKDGNVWNHAQHEIKVRQGARQFGPRATLYKAFTTAAARFVENASLDFIFIDADHSEQAVKQDIFFWKPKLKRTGMLSGHDIDWPGVQSALEKLEIKYSTGPDNVWHA